MKKQSIIRQILSDKIQSHCSGHSKGEFLLDIVKSIDAKMLYPVHTEHPEAYQKITDKITLVKEAKKYDLSVNS